MKGIDAQLQRLMKSLPCGKCGAEPWHHCVTAKGEWAHMHAARREPIYDAYGIGYNDCEDWYARQNSRPVMNAVVQP